jgi:sialate O-acetylesterase
MKKSIKFASLFSDHAILQREMPVPIWGWAPPLSRIQITCGQFVATGISNVDGEFCVRLPAMMAGGPFDLTAEVLETGEQCKSVGILVGEVWLASGQSNMEWTFRMLGEACEKEIVDATEPQIRMLTVPRNAILGGRGSIQAEWKTLTPSEVLDFSAVATYFARKLHCELGVPVGILNASWGGTQVEAWISRRYLVKNEFFKHRMARIEADLSNPDYWQGMSQFLTKTLPADPGNQGARDGWASPHCEESLWKEALLPNPWLAFGHNHSGVFWFRKTLRIPSQWIGKPLQLELGAIDKQDITYVNGVQVGATGKGFDEEHWNTPRTYVVPAEVVHSEMLTIAVRAYSFIYQGGLIGPAESMRISPTDEVGEFLPLNGTWIYRMEHDLGVVTPPTPPYGPGNANTPAILFDSMLKPLQGFAMRGSIWYQGESNADRANEYASLLPDMIENWRTDWGLGDFPFLIVQLANFRAPSSYESASTWARLREAQLHALQEKNTGMAVAIDLGEAADIHPKNKKDVGERLALWALAKTYCRNTPHSGPIYQQMSIEGKAIRIAFDHTENGLSSTDGELMTFMVAGKDRFFFPAEAAIQGHTVLVSSPEVPDPEAVRYAWADNPVGPHLINSAGLPASPFRTDRWH